MKRFALLAVFGMGLAYSAAASAQSFWDGFDNNNFNPSIWVADSGSNGAPFGCAFSPSMIVPGTGGYLNLTLHPGSCAEMKTKSQYLYGTVQTRMQYSFVPGTVASLFTYNSWYINPGNPWTEIDIEFLPSYLNGNYLHTNVLYEAAQNDGNLQQFEKYIDLTPYGINGSKIPVQVGFDWTPTTIAWYIFDSGGTKRYLRTLTKTNGAATQGCECVPSYAWPSRPANIYANYWHGNDQGDADKYFPGHYDNASGGAATYDWIQYIYHQ